MKIVWKKKEPLENYEYLFTDVICAKAKDVFLKVFCVKDPDKNGSLIVTWIANNHPNKEFHVAGSIRCAKTQKAPTYKLAKKRAEAFVRFWLIFLG